MLKIKSGQDWLPEQIEEIYSKLEEVNNEKYKLDIYSNQIEIISSEQMLDAYSSHGLPVFYPHWSHGEQFVKELEAYKRGHMGLAYEVVINSNPCIAYLMEENTLLMQALVLAHASFGHNAFFKNNYLFKMWTDADSIIDYLVFAKKYIMECEEKYGHAEVEAVIDAAHAIQMHGVDKYKRPSKLSAAQEEKLRIERERYNQLQVNEIWNTIPKDKTHKQDDVDKEKFPSEPQENLLYFIEKNAPRLKEWQREIIRIVRKIAQYFYPQYQTKLMNEGFATFFHYKFIHDLYDCGMIDDGAMLEFYKSHTGVVRQLDYSHKYYNGINPYALGFEMYKDIERIAMDPTNEDREWFKGQDWVGCGDWIGTIKWAAENFKDESFIRQFLSPKLIRDFRMFAVTDDEQDPMTEISAIHNAEGYRRVRSSLADQYDIGFMVPNIQVTNVDRWGDRSLTLRHTMVNNIPLHEEQTLETLQHISWLWGYPVSLESVNANNDVIYVCNVHGSEASEDIFLDE